MIAVQFAVHLHMNIEQQWKAIKYWAIVEEQLSQVATQPVQHNSPTIRPPPTWANLVLHVNIYF